MNSNPAEKLKAQESLQILQMEKAKDSESYTLKHNKEYKQLWTKMDRNSKEEK